MSCRKRSILSWENVVVMIGYEFCSRDLRLLFRPLIVRAFVCLGAVVDAIINLDWFGDMACRQTLAVTS